VTTAAPQVFFDGSLVALTDAVRSAFGPNQLHQGVVLRDASGRLSYVAPIDAPSEDERTRIAVQLEKAIGAYGRQDWIITYRDDPGGQAILEDPSKLSIQLEDGFCQLVDRRIVGSGWLDQPSDSIKLPPRIVFASLKGGVGRSTAIAVAAADLSRKNKNILVIDLDLEAPGLGALLLDDVRVPRFGVIDFLVENGIGGVSDTLLDDFVGTSAMTTGEGGRVDIVPAFGRDSLSHPENILPKLSRAMIEDFGSEGESITVSAQLSIMIDRLVDRNAYDVILIDSRAGLSELAAPAVLGLGATVLLFGTAQYQTIQGYRAFFAALKLLAQRDRAKGRPAEWRLLFKPVYAKASFSEPIVQRHTDDLYELFAEHLYDAEQSAEISEDAFAFNIGDETAPHWPLMIPFNQSFLDFDPPMNPKHLTSPFYEQTFRPFLNGLEAIIMAARTSVDTEVGE
jgi:hypothetical protein